MPERHPETFDRRALLCGGCAAFALSACKDPAGTSPDTGPLDTGGDPTAPALDPDDPLANPDYPCSPPLEPGAEGWRAFALSEHPELAEVGGHIATSTPNGNLFIVAHVVEGCYVAAARRCTHQGVLMTYEPSRGQFVCPRHGSLFDWRGAPVGGPATAPIEVYTAGRDGDTIWVKAPD